MRGCMCKIEHTITGNSPLALNSTARSLARLTTSHLGNEYTTNCDFVAHTVRPKHTIDWYPAKSPTKTPDLQNPNNNNASSPDHPKD